MPTSSAISSDDKTKIKNALKGNTSNKIHTAAVARIFYAHPNPREWAYTGLEGGLGFVKDSSRGSLYFRLVDLSGTRGVIWEHELYESFEYNTDRPFFHSFPGDVSNTPFELSLLGLCPRDMTISK